MEKWPWKCLCALNFKYYISYFLFTSLKKCQFASVCLWESTVVLYPSCFANRAGTPINVPESTEWCFRGVGLSLGMYASLILSIVSDSTRLPFEWQWHPLTVQVECHFYFWADHSVFQLQISGFEILGLRVVLCVTMLQIHVKSATKAYRIQNRNYRPNAVPLVVTIISFALVRKGSPTIAWLFARFSVSIWSGPDAN